MSEKHDWNYEEELAQAKAELTEWEFGIETEGPGGKFLKEICMQAGGVVLEQLSNDFREDDGIIELDDNNDIQIWSLSGDHFMVVFNVSKAIREWVEVPRAVDMEDRECMILALRDLVDELEAVNQKERNKCLSL